MQYIIYQHACISAQQCASVCISRHQYALVGIIMHQSASVGIDIYTYISFTQSYTNFAKNLIHSLTHESTYNRIDDRCVMLHYCSMVSSVAGAPCNVVS